MDEHEEPPRQSRLAGRLRVVGVVALAVAIFLACTRPVPLPVLDHAPASNLSLVIAFDDNNLVSDTAVVLGVDVFSGGHEFALSSKQHLTCNGVTLSQPSPYGGLSAKVDRQPAGGSYAFTYTDEQGHTTAFRVPAVARLALTSPSPGGAVAIPRRVATVPTPSTIEGTRTPDLAHVPLTVRYAVPSLPPYSVAYVSMEAQCATSRMRYGCGLVEGQVAVPVTAGTYSITDATIAYSYGFETFVPGPGYIRSHLQVTWWQVTDFLQVKVTYSSYADSPVVWTASAGSAATT